MNDGPYDYTTAGFSPFLSRSIDDQVGAGLTLDNTADIASNSNRALNYDQSQLSGMVGSIMQFGNIRIDGITGRISIYDNDGNEVARFGAL
jgi:hypothetical protein